MRPVNVRALATAARAALRRPFAEAKESQAPSRGQQREPTESIGATARRMAREGVTDDGRWAALVENVKASLPNLTPLDIAFVLNALSRTRRADAALYATLAKRVSRIVEFFSSWHLAMIIAAYAKADLMEEGLYETLKTEIGRRLYEFTEPTELCMVFNALARCKERDEAFLRKVTAHIRHHLDEFITQEITLVATRMHTLDLRDEELLKAVEEQVTRYIGRFLASEAMGILAAFSHFQPDNKAMREILLKHIHEQHVYLRGETFVQMVEKSRLSDHDKTELLQFEQQ